MRRADAECSSWAFYDWANSAFATGGDGRLLSRFLQAVLGGGPGGHRQYLLARLVNSAASLIIVVSAPLLGAIADQAGREEAVPDPFTVLGVLSSGALFLLAKGQWGMALCDLSCWVSSGSPVAISSTMRLLVDVARPGVSSASRPSATPWAILAGVCCSPSTCHDLFPSSFGFADGARAVRVSFLGVALWWALFAVPVALWVPERRPRRARDRAAMRGRCGAGGHPQAHSRLAETFLFLVAYWFYIDGVDTIVRMAVDFGLSIGFEANSLMVALLITQFVGFPAALVFGRLGERWGVKRSILLAIGIYMLVIVGASRMDRVEEFYLLAVAIGLVQGGIQALSRALFASLIPPGRRRNSSASSTWSASLPPSSGPCWWG